MVVGYLVTIRCDLLDLCTPDTLHLSSHFAIYLAASFGEQHTCMYFFCAGAHQRAATKPGGGGHDVTLTQL